MTPVTSQGDNTQNNFGEWSMVNGEYLAIRETNN